MNRIEALDIEINSTCSPYESLLNLNELRVGKMNNTGQEKLFRLVKNYDFNIKTTPINNKKIPFEHEVNLTDTMPVITHPRIITHSKKEKVYDFINNVEGWIIQPSNSPYSSAIVPVIKKDGSIRLGCDYKQLNTKIIPKSSPIPR